jgi:hypothetical protein
LDVVAVGAVEVEDTAPAVVAVVEGATVVETAEELETAVELELTITTVVALLLEVELTTLDELTEVELIAEEDGELVDVAVAPPDEAEPVRLMLPNESEAEYALHRAYPTEAAEARSPAAQLLIRQFRPREPIFCCPSGVHWHAVSVGTHPAAVMAEERHGFAHSGSPERFCARARGRSARRLVVRSFMVDKFRRG